MPHPSLSTADAPFKLYLPRSKQRPVIIKSPSFSNPLALITRIQTSTQKQGRALSLQMGLVIKWLLLYLEQEIGSPHFFALELNENAKTCHLPLRKMSLRAKSVLVVLCPDAQFSTVASIVAYSKCAVK